MRSLSFILFVLAAAVIVPRVASAQHEEHMAMSDSMDMSHMMPGALGIPHARLGSGTSWVPEASPHYGWHEKAGSWSVMVHGQLFVNYDAQFGPRGDDQWNSVNWGMLMAMHPLAGGMLHFHGMLSAEPATVGAQGYPLLLQTGESHHDQPLVDRQHPHDLFMELALMYERAVARDLAFSVYVAPSGEPAIGPVAYPHRASAQSDPLAPLGHHWQDATHTSFGVITAGVFTRTWKLEGSIFNGREPDEVRTNFDLRPLDSYAGRLFVNPTPHWSLSASYAYLDSPEELHPEQSIHRVSASAIYSQPVGDVASWSTSFVYGANKYSGVPGLSNSALLETNVDVDSRNTVFGRVEYVAKSAEDLNVNGADPAVRYNVGEVTVGYARELARRWGAAFGIGVAGTLNVVPEALAGTYGARTPVGLDAYLRVWPARTAMRSTMPHGMGPMGARD